MYIDKIGNDSIVETDNLMFTHLISSDPRGFNKHSDTVDNLDWNNRHSYIQDYIVYPYGSNNDLPDIIKKAVQNNSIAPGIITKKTQLLWGLGPQLYKEIIKDNLLIRQWQEDVDIQRWLDSWDFEGYLLKCCKDYEHVEGAFTKFELSKGSRVGEPFISTLSHVYPDRARLASERSVLSREATHVITSDVSFNNAYLPGELKIYPIFDFNQPFKNKNSIMYSNMYSFCTDYYTVPDIFGSLEWIYRSTAVPLIFKALSKNSMNLKFHIESPAQFWVNKADEIKNNCNTRGIVYNMNMLKEYQEQFLEKIAAVLSSDENSGKFLHTPKEFTVEGSNLIEHGWKVNVIDQRIKDFVDSQIKISERADHALSAGNLHSALGNVSESGKSDSGSEQLYALKTYLLTGINIPEKIITKAVNYALKANFPTKDLKIGFYHLQPEKEQDISPKKRIKNNI